MLIIHTLLSTSFFHKLFVTFPPFLCYRWYLTQKKTLEINPRHPLVKELQRRVEKDESDDTTVDLAKVLFDTAILRSGYALPDSSSFASRIERMLRLSVGVDSDAPVSSFHCH